MEQTVNLTLSQNEALMIITALGTYQNRVGQHARWAERKRIPTLNRMATEAAGTGGVEIIYKKKEWTQRYIETAIADGHKCNELKERIKQAAGITDAEKQEKVRDDMLVTVSEQDLRDFYYMVRWYSQNVGNTFHYLWRYMRKHYPKMAETYGDSPED